VTEATTQTPQPTVLTGRRVRLEPMTPDHVPALFAAGGDPEVWRWLWVAPPADEAAMAEIVAGSLAMRRRITWTIVADGVVAGSSSYYAIDPVNSGLEIGFTWLGRRWWRTGVNLECKLLMLGHAFDQLGFERVGLRTDHQNLRSQQALTDLGAVREGTLRHHIRRPDGTWRDTVYFSILRDEWPAVRDRVNARLDRNRAS
jgi:N-acetyltransferase